MEEISTTTSLTALFSQSIVRANPTVSAQAMEEAKKGIIDYIAVCFAGKNDSGVDKLIALFKAENGTQHVPIIGRSLKFSASSAALVNGFLAHALDFDDVHSDVRGHPSAVILPALISASATRNVSSQRFLAAYSVGIEVMARLGKAIGSQHFVSGWHNTSTLGVIAATVAVAYLKEFTALQIAKAIGFAATQSSGLRVHFGTETKPLHAGLAAQAALRSIDFVEADISGSLTALDGTLGFFEVYGEGSEFATPFLVENWGVSWKIVTPGLWFKIFPFCSAAHHAADATMHLMTHHLITPEEIKEVIVTYPSNGDAALIQSSPKTGEEGRFSVEYVISLIVHGYPLSFSNFSNIPIESTLQNFMAKVKRNYDDTIVPASNAVPSGRFTIVDIVMKEGKRYESRVDCPKGSPQNPLSLSDLEVKLKQCINDDILSATLLDKIHGLSNDTSMQELFNLV